MPVYRQQLRLRSIEWWELALVKLLSVYQLASSVQLLAVTAGTLQKNHHHLVVDLEQLNHPYLPSHACYQSRLVQFEKFHVFDEERDHVVLILDTVERSDPQKLVKFLFGGRQFYLQLPHKSFIRHHLSLSHRFGVCPPFSFPQAFHFRVLTDPRCHATGSNSILRR